MSRESGATQREAMGTGSVHLPSIEGIPMGELWPEMKEELDKRERLAQKSSRSKRRYGQCKPAY